MGRLVPRRSRPRPRVHAALRKVLEPTLLTGWLTDWPVIHRCPLVEQCGLCLGGYVNSLRRKQINRQMSQRQVADHSILYQRAPR